VEVRDRLLDHLTDAAEPHDLLAAALRDKDDETSRLFRSDPRRGLALNDLEEIDRLAAVVFWGIRIP
jgi:hypothetical protein